MTKQSKAIKRILAWMDANIRYDYYLADFDPEILTGEKQRRAKLNCSDKVRE